MEHLSRVIFRQVPEGQGFHYVVLEAEFDSIEEQSDSLGDKSNLIREEIHSGKNETNRCGNDINSGENKINQFKKNIDSGENEINLHQNKVFSDEKELDQVSFHFEGVENDFEVEQNEINQKGN